MSLSISASHAYFPYINIYIDEEERKNKHSIGSRRRKKSASLVTIIHMNIIWSVHIHIILGQKQKKITKKCIRFTSIIKLPTKMESTQFDAFFVVSMDGWVGWMDWCVSECSVCASKFCPQNDHILIEIWVWADEWVSIGRIYWHQVNCVRCKRFYASTECRYIQHIWSTWNATILSKYELWTRIC